MATAAEVLSLLFACSGIFFSFSYFAVLQEDVYKKPYGEDKERFAFTFLALAVERGVNALIALLGMVLLGGSGVKIPHREIFNSGVSQMLAMAGSNEALRYVSFATQVLGKSCKMVPVMVGGLLLGGAKYETKSYVQVALITLGVCIFNFGGKKKGGSAGDSSYGLFLIAFSLVMDAVTGGLQDKVKKSTKKLNPDNEKAKPSMHESMFWTNLSGFFVAVVLGFLTGHMTGGVAFCQRCGRAQRPGRDVVGLALPSQRPNPDPSRLRTQTFYPPHHSFLLPIHSASALNPLPNPPPQPSASTLRLNPPRPQHPAHCTRARNPTRRLRCSMGPPCSQRPVPLLPTRNPEVISAIFIYSVSSAVGQNFIYYTITQFSPLILTTVTTTRKIFSTVYSVLRNPSNSLDNMQWGGCGLVFVGLLVDIVDGAMPKKAPPPTHTTATAQPATDSKPKSRPKKVD